MNSLINKGVEGHKIAMIQKVVDSFPITREDEVLRFEYNTGNTCTIIPKYADYVATVYMDIMGFRKVAHQIENGVIQKFKHLVQPIHINYDLMTIVWEKVIPMKSSETIYIDQQKEMFSQISKTIEDLPFSHGQPTLDNIGFSPKRDCYVLYDFNKMNPSRNLLKDMMEFSGSFNNNGLKIIEYGETTVVNTNVQKVDTYCGV